LRRAAEHHGPEFVLLDVVTDGLGTLHDVTDLDAIDRGGAMLLAAERLMSEVGDATLAEATSHLVHESALPTTENDDLQVSRLPVTHVEHPFDPSARPRTASA
jgi:hypothetical protein